MSWVTTGWWAQTTRHVRQHHVGSTTPARTAPLLYGALRRHPLWRSRWQLPGERRLLMGSTCNMVAHNVSHAHRTPVREATRTVTRLHRNSLHWTQHRRCRSSPPCKARYTTGLTHGGNNQSGQLDTCAATAPACDKAREHPTLHSSFERSGGASYRDTADTVLARCTRQGLPSDSHTRVHRGRVHPHGHRNRLSRSLWAVHVLTAALNL